eukprot:Hpha_TRINITY_DN10878_c0_g1::TRINITY_DN10878_c0_g1_i1::g.23095::m.23095
MECETDQEILGTWRYGAKSFEIQLAPGGGLTYTQKLGSGTTESFPLQATAMRNTFVGAPKCGGRMTVNVEKKDIPSLNRSVLSIQTNYVKGLDNPVVTTSWKSLFYVQNAGSSPKAAFAMDSHCRLLGHEGEEAQVKAFRGYGVRCIAQASRKDADPCTLKWEAADRYGREVVLGPNTVIFVMLKDVHEGASKRRSVETSSAPLAKRQPAGVGLPTTQPTRRTTSLGATSVADSPRSSQSTSLTRRVSSHGDMGRDPYLCAPLRLRPFERQALGLLRSALQVSEYTDKVDGRSLGHERLMKQELYNLLQNIQGLLICANGRSETTKILSRAQGHYFREIANKVFHNFFEVFRRYKRMNPDKLRTEYGKMMWVAQDYVQYFRGNITPSVNTADHVLRPMVTDPHFAKLRSPDPSHRAAARAALLERHGGDEAEVVENALYSYTDAFESVQRACEPIDRLLHFLHHYFAKDAKRGGEDNLGIQAGYEGSKLTHSHSVQYRYVRESLMLWRNILKDSLLLWANAEEDMLDPGVRYHYRNTGQGFHRVLRAPRVNKRMQQIIAQTHQELGEWIGIKVVHLGDNDVPNALVFIDKYCQVSRILSPLAHVIDALPSLSQLPGQAEYIRRKFGGVDQARKKILRDFFRHGFDGSGDSGGNCIDGRLTSAWNWCQKLPKKDYYHLFLLTGFHSFDGSFS